MLTVAHVLLVGMIAGPTVWTGLTQGLIPAANKLFFFRGSNDITAEETDAEGQRLVGGGSNAAPPTV